MTDFQIVPYNCMTGKENMEYDENLLNNAILSCSDKFYFRLYGWEPSCVSLGRNQSSDFVNKLLLDELGIDIVHRLTGGRALLHDKELTYSVVCHQTLLNNGQSVLSSYKEISEILIDSFAKLDVALSLGGDAVHTNHDYCMLVSTGADLNYQGKKLVGSAQCRKKGYILQHGSILFDYDKTLLEKIFNEPVDGASIISIKEIFPDISFEDFVKNFSKAISEVLSQKLY